MAERQESISETEMTLFVEEFNSMYYSIPKGKNFEAKLADTLLDICKTRAYIRNDDITEEMRETIVNSLKRTTTELKALEALVVYTYKKSCGSYQDCIEAIKALPPTTSTDEERVRQKFIDRLAEEDKLANSSTLHSNNS